MHTSDFPVDSRVGQFHLTRLNDALRACGLAPISRGLDSIELMTACTEAIIHLGSRSRELPIVAAPVPKSLPPKEEDTRLAETREKLEASSLELVRLKRELFQQKTELSNQRTSLNHYEHLLRQKDIEIENLNARLGEEIAQQDRRSAQAVATVRDENIGGKARVVIENYQREIHELTQDNLALEKKTKTNSVLLDQICKQLKISQTSQIESTIAKLIHSKSQLEMIEEMISTIPGNTCVDKIRLVLDTSADKLGSKICRIFHISSQQDIVPIFLKMDQKMNDFDAFYASLCCVLGLGSRASYAECLDRLAFSPYAQ